MGVNEERMRSFTAIILHWAVIRSVTVKLITNITVNARERPTVKYYT